MLLEHRNEPAPSRSWLGRAVVLAGVVLAGFFVIGVFNVEVKPPCSDPIGYRIGSIDPQFGIGALDLRKAIAAANGVWSRQVGHDLFRYDPDASLAINLVYDWRQRASHNEIVAEGEIDRLNTQTAALKAQMQPLRRSLETGGARFEASLAQYNNEIRVWNTLGGATEEARTDFRQRQEALEQQRTKLNQQKDRFNALVVEYNALVHQINDKAASINSDGLAGREYLKGIHVRDSQGEHIDIFEYKQQSDLTLVLTHELGHALGLVHNGNPKSIMSPVLKEATLNPTPDDLADLKQVCHLK